MDYEVNRLKRSSERDPENRIDALHYLRALSRTMQGESNLGITMDRSLWNRIDDLTQDQAIERVDKLLGENFEFVRCQHYSCGGITQRIATFVHSQTGIELNLIPGGSYLPAQPNGELDKSGVSQQQREVTVNNPFLIGRFPVTNEEWNRLQEFSTSSESPTLPVVSKSWLEVNRWLEQSSGLRLPSEIEWEYACRGGVFARYFWGNEWDSSYCWCHSNSGGNAHPLNDHLDKTNGFGLIDMLGNVDEFCKDSWVHNREFSLSAEKPIQRQKSEYRVRRGGNWCFGAYNCTPGHRNYSALKEKSNLVGFRVAATVLTEERKKSSQSLFDRVMSSLRGRKPK